MTYKRNIKPDAAKEYISPEASSFAARSKRRADFGAPSWTAIMKDKFQEFMFMTMDAGLPMEHAWTSMNSKMLLGPDYRWGTPEYNRSSYARAVMQMNDGKSWTDVRMIRQGKKRRVKEPKAQAEIPTLTEKRTEQPKDFVATRNSGRIVRYSEDSSVAQVTRPGYFWYTLPAGFVPDADNPIIHTDAVGTRTYKLRGELTCDMPKDDPLVKRLVDKMVMQQVAKENTIR